MHLSGSGLTKHLDNFLAGRTTDDRIVDDRHSVAFQELAHRVQLDFDPEVPDGFLRLDKGPPHVVIADQAELKRDPGGARKAESSSHAGIGNRYHKICVCRMLSGQLLSHLVATRMHTSLEDSGVGPGKVDVFKDAMAVSLGSTIVQEVRCSPRNSTASPGLTSLT